MTPRSLIPPVLVSTFAALAFTAAPALADTAPTVTIKPASAVAYTKATVSGTVNPNGGPSITSWRFEYTTNPVEGWIPFPGGEFTEAESKGKAPVKVEATLEGLAPNTAYQVRLVAVNEGGETISAEPNPAFTTKAVVAPTVSLDPVSTFTGTTARFTGKVDPNAPGGAPGQDPGFNTSWHFECTPECPGLVGGELEADNTSKEVSAETTGLLPNALYMVTLVASNLGGEAAATPVPFTTSPIKPTIVAESEKAQNITETSADLTAEVDPNGAPVTSCTFEYATGTAGETSVPCAQSPAQIGGGRAPVIVSGHLAGLKEGSNVTYHWRLVVVGAGGSTTSVDHTFVDDTQPATPPGSCPGQEAVREAASSLNLPDCRAYEMVTPPEKNGAHVSALFAGTGSWGPLISADGTDVMAPSIQCFAQAESCTGIRALGEGEPYEFARTSEGWITHALAPSAATFGNTSQLNEDATTHDTLFNGPGDGHRDHFYVRTGTGTPRDIGPLGESAEPIEGENDSLLTNALATVATADFSHLLFAAESGNHTNFLWALSGQPEKDLSLYEYAGTGNTRPLLVGVEGGFESTQLVSECGTALGDLSYTPAVEYGSLSADGHMVDFTAVGLDNKGVCAGEAKVPSHDELFVRVDGENALAHTVAVSAPTPASCTSAECKASQSEPRDASFAGASSDGSRVFFTSTQQLTDSASQAAEEPGGEGEAGENCKQRTESGQGGCNLYESVCAEPCGTASEEPAAAERELVDVSDPQGTEPVPGGPRVQGVMAISPDGSHVYFVARGEIPGAGENQSHEHPTDGENNLYGYQRDEENPGGKLTFIATLPKSDEERFEQQQFVEFTSGIGVANVTPDGRFLVFLSHAALTADDTRPDVEGGPTPPAQIYRYDAQTGQIVRISIGQHGFDDDGNDGTAGLTEPNIVQAKKGWQTAASPGTANPTMSEDGQEVFFESPAALAPGALNEVKVNEPRGTRELFAQNIYEYRDGQVYLISDGKDTNPNPGDPSTKSSTRLIGTDESGKDVFFWTGSQVLPQDTDTQRDIYDARICETGAPCVAPPTAPQACEEAGCQGQAPAATVPGTPASASFNGPGNLAPPPPAPAVKPKPLTRAQKLAKALKACRSKHNKHKRVLCERTARRTFGAKASAKKARKSAKRASRDRGASR